jgi:glutathione S-transferase
MSDTPFKPVLYLKQNCPFCLKLRIFLLEAGLLGTVTLNEFAPGSAGEAAIRAELAGKVEKITFPTAKLTPDSYLTGSDEIVAALAAQAGVDLATLPTYRSYLDGAFKTMQTLYMDNIALKKQLA